MTLRTTTPLAETTCPGCGTVYSAATSLDDGHQPSPGDYTICVECTAMLVFTDDLSTRLLTPEEFIALDSDVVLVIGRLRTAIGVVHAPPKR